MRSTRKENFTVPLLIPYLHILLIIKIRLKKKELFSIILQNLLSFYRIAPAGRSGAARERERERETERDRERERHTQS